MSVKFKMFGSYDSSKPPRNNRPNRKNFINCRYGAKCQFLGCEYRHPQQCQIGYDCKGNCGLRHLIKRCRYGVTCNNKYCGYLHPVNCPKGLYCMGECKLQHIGRIEQICPNNKSCPAAGRETDPCKYIHKTIPICRYGFECPDKDINCQNEHETLEEYNDRIAENPEIKWETEFVSNAGLRFDTDVYYHACSCPYCDHQAMGRNNYCSAACGGFSKEKPQFSTESGAQGPCRDVHCKCIVEGCNRKRNLSGSFYMGDQAYGNVKQLLCKYHAPKCFCGKPTFIKSDSKISIDNKTDLLTQVHPLYEKVCNQHYWQCPIKDCKKPRNQIPYLTHETKYLYGQCHSVNQYLIHHYCDTHAPICEICHLKPCAPSATENKYTKSCVNCEIEWRKNHKVLGTQASSKLKCSNTDCKECVFYVYTKYEEFSNPDQKIFPMAEPNWRLQPKCVNCAPKCNCGQPLLNRVTIYGEHEYYKQCHNCTPKCYCGQRLLFRVKNYGSEYYKQCDGCGSKDDSNLPIKK